MPWRFCCLVDFFHVKDVGIFWLSILLSVFVEYYSEPVKSVLVIIFFNGK